MRPEKWVLGSLRKSAEHDCIHVVYACILISTPDPNLQPSLRVEAARSHRKTKPSGLSIAA
jgi:hypothetical protein